MRNQPKYNFLRNTRYALQGLCDLISSEKSFQIELIFCIILIPIIIVLDHTITNKILMISSLFGVLIAETINSAIERTVDLVTLEEHIMAGKAKDMGSAIVFISIINCLIICSIILIN